MRRFEDKVAFITGGAGGIGSATARRLLEEGARVAIADINLDAAAQTAERLGPAAHAVVIDIGDEASVNAAIDNAYQKFGRLDVLFNNAALTDVATMSADTDITQVPLAVWKRTLDVNLTGYMLCCRRAIPLMAKAGGGVIVNTASSAGQASDVERVAYGTSKAGIISLTQYIATQHGKDGIRCNAIAPGPIVTAHTRKVVGRMLDIIENHMPMKALGAPDDAAALVAFLAADESRYINGQTIVIDGGMSARHAHVTDMQAFMAEGAK